MESKPGEAPKLTEGARCESPMEEALVVDPNCSIEALFDDSVKLDSAVSLPSMAALDGISREEVGLMDRVLEQLNQHLETLSSDAPVNTRKMKVIMNLILRCLERCSTQITATKGVVSKLPRLPIVVRELECIGARTDRNLRLHLAERLATIGDEVGAATASGIKANTDVTNLKSVQACLKSEFEALQKKLENLRADLTQHQERDIPLSSIPSEIQQALMDLARRVSQVTECVGLREEVKEQLQKFEAEILVVKKGTEVLAEKIQDQQLNLPRKISLLGERVDSLNEELAVQKQAADTQMGHQRTKVEDLDTRLNGLATRMTTELADSHNETVTAIGSQIADLRRSVETLERGQSHTQSILEGCNKKYEKTISYINTIDVKIKSIVTVMEASDSIGGVSGDEILATQHKLAKELEETFDRKLKDLKESSFSTPNSKVGVHYSPIVDREPTPAPSLRIRRNTNERGLNERPKPIPLALPSPEVGTQTVAKKRARFDQGMRRVYIDLSHPVKTSNQFILLDVTQLLRGLPLPPLYVNRDPRTWAEIDDVDRRKYYRADVAGGRYLEIQDNPLFRLDHDNLVCQLATCYNSLLDAFMTLSDCRSTTSEDFANRSGVSGILYAMMRVRSHLLTARPAGFRDITSRTHAFDSTSRGIFQGLRDSGRTGNSDVNLPRFSETLGQPVTLFRETPAACQPPSRNLAPQKQAKKNFNPSSTSYFKF